MSVLAPVELESTPTVPWGQFRAWFLENWEQGQHVTMVGPTGWGKTRLARELLPVRSYIVAFGVKGEDDSMDELIRHLRMERQQTFHPEVADRICLWPNIRGAGANHRKRQREVFLAAIDTIFRTGAWCCYFDEVVYLAETLKLEDELKFLLNQGRSSHISIVAATQRPAFIPLAFYDMATHLFLWKFNDHRNAARVAELTGTASRTVREEVMTLPKYEFLYIHKDTGLRVRSKVEV